MNELVKKEEALIAIPIKVYAEKALQKNLKIREGWKINQLEIQQITSILVDSEKSEFKGNLSVISQYITVNLELRTPENKLKKKPLNFTVGGRIEMSYNFEKKAYQINNEDELFLMEM